MFENYINYGDDAGFNREGDKKPKNAERNEAQAMCSKVRTVIHDGRAVKQIDCKCNQGQQEQEG